LALACEKTDLTPISNWEDQEQVFSFAKTCVLDIERCDTELLIKPTLGYQRDILGHHKGGEIRFRFRL